MRRRVMSVAVLAGFAAAVGCVAGPQGVSVAASPTAEPQLLEHAFERPRGSPSGDAAEWSPGGVPTWITSTFKQVYTIRDFRDVEVLDRQLNPQTGEWASFTFYGSASFDIVRAASAHQDLFCFAGFAVDGDFVVETWRAVPLTQTVDGATVPVTTSEGLAVKRFRKQEIYRGRLVDGLVELEFDFEGRFIMALAEDDGVRWLYRFENEPNTQPQVFSGTPVLPELAEMSFMQKFQHTDLGRVWLLWDEPAYDVQIAFLDDDNDGVFDGTPMVGDRQYYESAGFQDPDVWNDLLGD